MESPLQNMSAPRQDPCSHEYVLFELAGHNIRENLELAVSMSTEAGMSIHTVLVDYTKRPVM